MTTSCSPWTPPVAVACICRSTSASRPAFWASQICVTTATAGTTSPALTAGTGSLVAAA